MLGVASNEAVNAPVWAVIELFCHVVELVGQLAATGVLVGVLVAVAVGVLVAADVAVLVGVRVGVLVAADVDVLVGVALGAGDLRPKEAYRP